MFEPIVHKNIIFDLGGVLLNLNYNLTSTAFKKLGINQFDNLYTQAQQKGLFDDFEKGFIAAAEFRQGIRDLSGLVDLTDIAIDDAWNAMLLDFPLQRLRLLEKIAAHHQVYLLSNTNSIHINWYKNYLQRTFGFSNMQHIFKKEYLSYEMGMRKPDAEIFEHVLKENELDPQQTFYIDDSIQHVIGAKSIGVTAYWLDLTKENTEDVFSCY